MFSTRAQPCSEFMKKKRLGASVLVFVPAALNDESTGSDRRNPPAPARK